jgi:hypothetical protein
MPQKNDFATARKEDESWYDLKLDRDLIEASFAMQYGIRLRIENEMTWGEFCALLRGLGPETPLGRIVAIRSEKDPARIKKFSAAERKIRLAWRHKDRSIGQDWEKEIAGLQNILARAFGS